MSITSVSKPSKITLTTLQKMQGVEPIVMITAYDALFANLFDEQVEMILVGDSLNMSFYGKEDTLSATMDQMIYHTKAVCNGAKRAFVVFDMPFGSYNSPQEALKNAVRVYQETAAQAVKIEGGKAKAEVTRLLSDNGIAVIAHIGLMPQQVRSQGGYKVQGKEQSAIDRLIEDAKAHQEAGAAIVLVEGVKTEAAAAIKKAIDLPVIGIGAGADLDGQVLVWSDMLGFYEEFLPKFAKRYLEGASLTKEAVAQYASEVKEGKFPTKAHSY